MVTLATSAGDIELRDVGPDDIPVFLELIRAMGALEKLPVSATEQTLRDSLCGAEPVACALLVLSGGQPIGYVTYYFAFASTTGRRTLALDDVFVSESFRGRGIGFSLMQHLARIAVQRQCARFDWLVLDWNAPAVEFYRRLGADLLPDWRVCRLDEAALKRLAAVSR